MTDTTLHQRDHLIQDDVIEELAWAPQVRDAHVGVSVLDGVVTLSGEVDTVAERAEAGKAALRVKGVSVVTDELTIRGVNHLGHTDTDTGAAIKHVLDWTANLPKGSIQAEVHDHIVTLTGTVDWNFQRSAAERIVRGVRGVQRIVNLIELTPRSSAVDTSKLIENALVRHALQEAHGITVSASGSAVTLTGRVDTWAEKKDAGHAAWASPHTMTVHNDIVVGR